MKRSGVAYLKWQDEYSTGNENIDNQHQTMMDLINDFILYSFNSPPSHRHLKRALDGFLQFIEEHFMEEEILMLKHNDPNYANHKKDHDNFIEYLRTFEDTPQDQLQKDSINSLKVWLVKHIVCNDYEITKPKTESEEINTY